MLISNVSLSTKVYFEFVFKYADMKDNYVLFKFQTAGVADHVWAILQSPGPKYKIYQSYNMGNIFIFTDKKLKKLLVLWLAKNNIFQS